VDSPKLNILFAGGGTGGHLFPALAIADEIKKLRSDVTITFVGTPKKIEARVVPERGYAFVPIWISGFQRRWELGNILFPLKVVVAFVQSFFLMRKLKPAVVVGTGGYVCGPVVFVATLLGIPTLLQEQNGFPGVTTRLLASRVTQVYLTFETSKKYLKRSDNVMVSGNPTQEAIGTASREEAARYFDLDPSKQCLLVFGGSLGSRSINSAVLKILPDLLGRNIQVIWQTGEKEFESIRDGAERLKGGLRIYKFIEAMHYSYGVCDLAVCRAGATTVAELSRVGVPSVLVPYPFAAGDHQTQNAMAMVEAGASVMIRDAALNASLLETTIGLLADAGRLKEMAQQARQLGKPDAGKVLANAVLALAGA
jgi:UDP-N-acetylglucosamine--N-acetylmuramyl-(pentapeptide) pyrophosphoryl-undecaprenol N-acetylglucosamine transferase